MHDPYQNAFKKLYLLIQKAEHILICAHQKPDGDTLGSSSSLLNWLIREQKDAVVFCKSPVPLMFQYLDRSHLISNDPALFTREFDLIIVLDSGSLPYCGIDEYIDHMKTKPTIANIDHHATNELFGDLNIVMTSASSTAEVVARFYDANSIHVDDKMATSVLTGLMTDTGNFSNGATNAHALEYASHMLSYGARIHDIQRNINHVHTVQSLQLWGRILDRLRVNTKHDIAITYVLTKDLEGMPENAESGISNFLNTYLGKHETILFLNEQSNGTVKGSIRSVHRNIAKLAQNLGGGGHANAAGFTINGKIEETPSGPRIVGVDAKQLNDLLS
ncbi:MAG: DHH family phosphoesterase [bacterium]|nr:DHH family phosphoesterase [bacterium]